MKRIRRWVLYPGYVLGITVLFLYVLFPSDAAKEYISGYLGKQYPGYTVTMETVKPVLIVRSPLSPASTGGERPSRPSSRGLPE
ncbi:MAG: hypothetical protein JRD49_13080, partial [Deltaproteobacteria bacterium]|nr:hypothetical protein [Deltaproteobacteria bacterium]